MDKKKIIMIMKNINIGIFIYLCVALVKFDLLILANLAVASLDTAKLLTATQQIDCLL